MLEGIGVLGVLVGQDFALSGFMHSSLYLLLRELISSSAQIRTASDAVLRALATAGGHCSVICCLGSCYDFCNHYLIVYLKSLPACTGWPICCRECRLHY